jgi:hypothetical protein
VCVQWNLSLLEQEQEDKTDGNEHFTTIYQIICFCCEHAEGSFRGLQIEVQVGVYVTLQERPSLFPLHKKGARSETFRKEQLFLGKGGKFIEFGFGESRGALGGVCKGCDNRR